MESYVRNSLVQSRQGEEPPFTFVPRGDIDGDVLTVVRIDGYAVVPLEHYNELKAKAGAT